MLVQNPVGLFLAALLGTRIRGAWIYRTIIFTPTILSVVIVGFVWKLILNPAWGISRSILQMVGLVSLDAPWLGLEATALVTLALISVWQNIGIPMMLFLAALIRIPEELLEAARLDGAGPWRIFWAIQFPLILPTAGIVSVLTFVGNFNAFELIYATQGALAGPNFASDILGTLFLPHFFWIPTSTRGSLHGVCCGRGNAGHYPCGGATLPFWLAAPVAGDSLLASDGKTDFHLFSSSRGPRCTLSILAIGVVPCVVDHSQLF